MEDVRYIARKIHQGLPYHVSFEDLLHDGVVGLIDAAHKYDLARGASFRTYAKFRIQGAILDSMRQMDWGPPFAENIVGWKERSRSLPTRWAVIPPSPNWQASYACRFNNFRA